MIQIEKILSYTIDITSFFPDLDNEEVIFFDIETTGLSSTFSSIYLISCIYYHNNKWNLIQLLDKTAKDEKIILHKFIELCKLFNVIFHFNGRSFDIPFLRERARRLNLFFPEDYKDVDLYQMIRPYKTFFQLENVKLKTIETYMGIIRKDLYNGGELISQYYHYVKSSDPSIEENLLLHNREDVTSLLEILPMVSFINFLKNLQNLSIPFIVENIDSSMETYCLIFLRFNHPIPFQLSFSFNGIHCIGDAGSSTLSLKIPLLSTTLFLFFDNVKEYYYIPEIDEAVHESVAQFYPSHKRKRAKKSNCYIKKKGTFIPFFKEKSFHFQLFYDQKHKNPFILYEDILQDKTALALWIRYFLEISLPS